MIEFGTKKNKQKLFLVTSDNVSNKAPILLPVIRLDDVTAFATTPVPPLHLYLKLNKKFPKHSMGVVLLANPALKPEHVLMHNARNAFFSLGLPQLKLICQDQKI